MTPSHKHEHVESEIRRLFGFDRRVHIRSGRCVPSPIGCGGPAVEFRDEASRKEFSISGLCQRCQDSIWPPEGEPD